MPHLAEAHRERLPASAEPAFELHTRRRRPIRLTLALLLMLSWWEQGKEHRSTDSDPRSWRSCMPCKRHRCRRGAPKTLPAGGCSFSPVLMRKWSLSSESDGAVEAGRRRGDSGGGDGCRKEVLVRRRRWPRDLVGAAHARLGRIVAVPDDSRRRRRVLERTPALEGQLDRARFDGRSTWCLPSGWCRCCCRRRNCRSR